MISAYEDPRRGGQRTRGRREKIVLPRCPTVGQRAAGHVLTVIWIGRRRIEPRLVVGVSGVVDADVVAVDGDLAGCAAVIVVAKMDQQLRTLARGDGGDGGQWPGCAVA